MASTGATRSRWKSFSEAEQIEPSSLPIRYLQALDYYRLKDFPQAMDRFKAALELDPKFALATYYLGLTQLQTGDANGAAASFQRTLELDPTNFTAAYDLGTLEVKQNQVPEGMRHFEQAAQINPNYAPAFEALGELDLYLHRNDDAARALEHAVAGGPGFRQGALQPGPRLSGVGPRRRRAEGNSREPSPFAPRKPKLSLRTADLPEQVRVILLQRRHFIRFVGIFI